MARERKGQEAVRVRQRLDALLTARQAPAQPLRAASALPARSREFRFFGSLSTSYRRDERSTDGGGSTVVDSSLLNDVFVGGQGESEHWEWRGEFSGTEIQDFLDDDAELRVNTLFVEALGRGEPWGFGLGRLPGNRSGVIGRYDGARASYRATAHSRWNLRAGLPVEPFVSSRVDPDQQLVALSFEALEWIAGLDLELFAIQQWAEGLTDRTAVGAEWSWTDGARYVAGQLDYDLHFQDLNTAFLIGSWQVRPETNLNLLLDWRRLPTLTTRNALFGQPEGDLGALLDRFSRDELEELARDRTVRSRSATLGITHRLSERFQLAADLGVSDLSGSPASGGIESFEGTGRQISTFLQLIGTEILTRGDVGTVGLRFVSARDIELSTLAWSWRSPAWRRIRLNPLFDLVWRHPDVGDSVFTLRPGVRVDCRVGPLLLDLDARYEWSKGERFPGVKDEQAYTLLVGVRYDF